GIEGQPTREDRLVQFTGLALQRELEVKCLGATRRVGGRIAEHFDRRVLFRPALVLPLEVSDETTDIPAVLLERAVYVRKRARMRVLEVRVAAVRRKRCKSSRILHREIERAKTA